MSKLRRGVPAGVALSLVGVAAWLQIGLSALLFFEMKYRDWWMVAFAVALLVPLMPSVFLLPLLFVRATRRAASNGLAALGAGAPLGMIADGVLSRGDGPYRGLWFSLPFWAMMIALFVSLLVELRWPYETPRSVSEPEEH